MAYQKQTWVNDVTDVDATHMNHIEDGIEKAYGVKLLAVTDEEPSECSVGDKYFNTTTNKIYDAVDTDTWDDEGYDAESGVFYVVFEEQAIYTYNGITLIGVGSSGAGGESIPLATIFAYGGTTAPTGYLLCNGQAVSRTTYAELFSLIGTTYGSGNGSTTFNVPNIKGKVLVGLDTSQTEFDTLGETGGEKTHTLTIQEMPQHSHKTRYGSIEGGDGSGYRYSNSDGTSYAIVQNEGGGQAHNILQPYIVVNFIIKASSTTPIEAQVVNEESQSTTDTYSCDYVNAIKTELENAMKYSEWIELVNSGGNVIKYRKNKFLVEVDIFVTYAHNSDTKLATLPTGARPSSSVDNALTGAGLDYVHLYDSGDIYVYNENAYATGNITFTLTN